MEAGPVRPLGYTATIKVGSAEYTINISDNLGFTSALEALSFVRNVLLDDGVFSNGPTEALEISGSARYSSIKIDVRLDDDLQPPVEEPQAAPPDLEKEYEMTEITITFLGQKMAILTLIYYNKGRVILMPTGIDGLVVQGYMREENLRKAMLQLATENLRLDPSVVDILIYPGDPLEEEAVDYVRDWIREVADTVANYVPKEKNAKAFIGWRGDI